MDKSYLVMLLNAGCALWACSAFFISVRFILALLRIMPVLAEHPENQPTMKSALRCCLSLIVDILSGIILCYGVRNAMLIPSLGAIGLIAVLWIMRTQCLMVTRSFAQLEPGNAA